MKWLTPPLATLLVLAFGSLLQAEDGFRLRQLNPFNEPEPTPAPAQGQPVIGVPNYRLPSTQPEETLFDRIGDGTRTTLHRVGEVVKAPFQPLMADRRAAPGGRSQSWFQFPWSEEPDSGDNIRTVEEWMSQPRPRY